MTSIFSLEHILPEVIDEVKDIETHYGKSIPVIVAGGIYTGEDIKRFMDMGAAGVQMGTRFREPRKNVMRISGIKRHISRRHRRISGS